MKSVKMTLVGGPTVLIEMEGLRLLTDPTFDQAGEYRLPHVTLRKLTPPAIDVADLGRVDAVLLSHDQHADNLDTAGRAYLRRTPRVYTTIAGASRLGGSAIGLSPWRDATLTMRDGQSLAVVATPARHGPPGIEPLAGDVIGFVIRVGNEDVIYVTGDTVWYDGTAEVARRFSPRIVLLFAGAARTRGPFNLTMNANDALQAAHAFPTATIVPVHCEGWAHFAESRDDIENSFATLGVRDRLTLLEPGVPVDITLSSSFPA